MVTMNHRHKIDSQKSKRKELKHTTKENQQTIQGKTKRKRNKEIQNQLENKVLNDNKYIPINSYFKYKWTKCSNQKTKSVRLDTKTRAYNMLPIRDPLYGKGHI